MQTSGDISATARRIARAGRRGPDVRELFRDWRDRLAGSPRRLAALRRRLMIAGPIALAVLAVAGWLIFRPMPQPNYGRDSLKKVFTYTLLSDEFNRLPVEQRMELIGQLVQRLKGMSAGDSVVLAAFAAGIAGEARKHIEENASRLAIDLWDKYARQYASVPPPDRAAFMDATYLEFIRTMEAIAGEPSDKSDAERLAEARRQAKRDEEAIRSGNIPPPRALGRMFHFMRDNVGGHATNEQKARGQLMMRDMMRHFRGQDAGGGR